LAHSASHNVGGGDSQVAAKVNLQAPSQSELQPSDKADSIHLRLSLSDRRGVANL
jgi:hypothetical protein